MCVISLAAGEQGLERVVGWEGKAGGVDEELAGDVEEDEEEVESAETEDDVDLGDAGLLLEVVEGWVLGELPDRRKSAVMLPSLLTVSRRELWDGLLVELAHVVLGLLLHLKGVSKQRRPSGTLG